MSVIRIWPAQSALDDQLAAELAAGEACVVGRGGARDETWDGFWARLAPPPARELDAITARLALRVACARVDVGGFARVAGSRGFLAGAARFVAEAESAALTAGEIVRAVATVEGAAGERLRVLARVLGELERGVDRVGVSPERRRGAALRGLRHGHGDGASLVDDVEILPRVVWTPADVELVLALARRSTGRVVVNLSWGARRPETFGGVDAILAAFEARSELGNLELVLSDPATRRAPSLAILSAPTPEAELRALAAHARQLVDGGSAPEEIAVAARSPGVLAAGLADELERVGLGLEDRRGSALVGTPVARLALALLELGLPGRGFPREATLAVLGSRYVDGAETSHVTARRARELGLRDLGGAASTRIGDGVVMARLARIAELPAEATLAEHAGALAALLGDLGVGARARGLGTAVAQGGFAEIEGALARDQAAMSALEELLAGLPAAVETSGFVARLSRAGFAGVLADLMAETTLAPRGGRGGAVRLVGLEALAGRRFEHVLLAHLVDGVAPARASDDGVYGEGERWALNRALGRRVAPDGAGGERTAFERLMLEEALAAARASVLLSYPTTVADRPVPRSPFVDEIARGGAPLTVLGGSPIPPLARVVAPSDVLARVALEAWADPTGRVPPSPPLDAGGLVDLMTAARPERAARVRELAAIERDRWQAGTTGTLGEVCGEVPGLTARVGGSAEVPVSARQLEMMANCGWSFFAGRVLGVGANEEGTDSPSARSAGLLAHRCLEAFYRERHAAGRLPLVGDEGDHAALAAACAEVFATTEVVGHAGLWALGHEKLVDSLWRWVEEEAAHGAPGGGVPARFELAFGAGQELPALAYEVGEGGRFHISGRIDRLDRVPDGGSVVVDYKLGSYATQRTKLKEEHHLQLPLYAAAIRAAPGWGGRVDAAFVSLKDGKATKTLRAALGDAETDALLDDGLPARVADLAQAARGGAFTLIPVDCRNCPFRTACRVVALAGEENEA